MLESHHEVVGVSHDEYLAARTSRSPLLDPEIEWLLERSHREIHVATGAGLGTISDTPVLGDLRPLQRGGAARLWFLEFDRPRRGFSCTLEPP